MSGSSLVGQDRQQKKQQIEVDPDSDESGSGSLLSRFRPIGNDRGIKKGAFVYSSGTNPEGEKYELKCDIYVPKGEGPYPAIIAIHGGAWRAGAKWHMMRHAWKFVAADFVVVAVNYRHAPDYPFPAQIHDVKQAVRWMRLHAGEHKIDPDQIVGFGYSAGGHLVSLLGTTDADDGLEGEIPEKCRGISTRLSAVVAGAPPCEFSWIGKHSRALNYWMGATRRQDPARWRKASPITYVTKDDPPFWFFHGQDDQVVPLSTSQKMLEQLNQTGVPASRKVYSDYGHFTMFSNLDTVDVAIEFYNRVLKRSAVGKTRQNLK